jgi:hypothetical protein
VNGEFGHDKISFFLDTGATRTRLSPRFAEEFKSLVQQSGSKRTTKVTGVGGSAEVEAIEVPRLQMRIGGFEALREPATILTKDPGGNAAWYHVWAGVDIFERAKRVSLDFRAMRLSRSSCSPGQKCAPAYMYVCFENYQRTPEEYRETGDVDRVFHFGSRHISSDFPVRSMFQITASGSDVPCAKSPHRQSAVLLCIQPSLRRSGSPP